MVSKILLTLIAAFQLTTAKSQDSSYVEKLDASVRSIDSIIAVGGIMEEAIVRHVSDEGYIFRQDHYIYDIGYKILHKGVCEEVGYEQAAFYYDRQKIIKAIVIDTSSKLGPYQCEYFLKDDSIILVREKGIRDPKRFWDNESIVSTAKEYLKHFHDEIIAPRKQK